MREDIFDPDPRRGVTETCEDALRPGNDADIRGLLLQGPDLLQDDDLLGDIADEILRNIDETSFCDQFSGRECDSYDDLFTSSISDATAESPFSNAYSLSPGFYSTDSSESSSNVLDLAQNQENPGSSCVFICAAPATLNPLLAVSPTPFFTHSSFVTQDLQSSQWTHSVQNPYSLATQTSPFTLGLQTFDQSSLFSPVSQTSSVEEDTWQYMSTPQAMSHAFDPQTSTLKSNAQQSSPLVSNYSAFSHPSSVTILQDQSGEKLCYVCGNPAGMHNYYGGQVCNSCRAFFRRAVQNNTHVKFSCSKIQNCDINSKSWRSCQWCRFHKCLESGMNLSWVLNETERKARSERRSEMKKERQKVVSLFLSAKAPFPADLFTAEDDIYIREIKSEILNFVQLKVLKFCARNINFLEELLFAVYHGRTISAETLLGTELYLSKTVDKLMSSMSVMKDIPESDRGLLLSANDPCIRSFVHSIFLDSQSMMEHFSSLLSCVKRAEDQNDEDLQEVIGKFREISMDGTLQVHAVKYEQMYPDNWANDVDVESRHKELTDRVREWIYDGVGGGKVDEVQMILMNMVMLFTPDFISLQNSSVASTVQTKFAMLLSKYLKTKYAKPGSKFCKAMVVSSISRELKDMRLKRYVGQESLPEYGR